MLCDDTLCRAASYPKAFKNDVFDVEQFFRFSEDGSSKGTYVISVASKFLLRTEEAVHKYGKGIAEAQNERHRMLKGRDPDPLVCYLAFYEGKCRIVDDISMTYYNLHIKYRPVSHGDAHFQIEMWPRGGNSSKQQRRDDRTDAARAIALKFSGPYVMPEDQYSGDELIYLKMLQSLPEK